MDYISDFGTLHFKIGPHLLARGRDEVIIFQLRHFCKQFWLNTVRRIVHCRFHVVTNTVRTKIIAVVVSHGTQILVDGKAEVV